MGFWGDGFGRFFLGGDEALNLLVLEHWMICLLEVMSMNVSYQLVKVFCV